MKLAKNYTIHDYLQITFIFSNNKLITTTTTTTSTNNNNTSVCKYLQ